MRLWTKSLLGYFKRRFVTEVMPPQEHVHNICSIVEPNALSFAKKCLMKGDVIAVPTDTVYGLACDANNEIAVQKLYEIKGRDFQKPVAIYVKDLQDFRRYGKAEHLSEELLQSLLPGPITIIVERTKHLDNRFLNPNTRRIGIRNTNFDFLEHLSSAYDCKPLALTSANRSSQPSSLKIEEFCELWPKLGGVFNAGPIGLTEAQRAASTVIDLAVPGYYKIVREGVAFKETLGVLHNFHLQALGK